jgi:hypothetical protein
MPANRLRLRHTAFGERRIEAPMIALFKISDRFAVTDDYHVGPAPNLRAITTSRDVRHFSVDQMRHPDRPLAFHNLGEVATGRVMFQRATAKKARRPDSHLAKLRGMPPLLWWRRFGAKPPSGPINEPHIGRAHASQSRRFEALIAIFEDSALARSYMQTPSRFQEYIRSRFTSARHILDRHDGIKKVEQSGGS